MDCVKSVRVNEFTGRMASNWRCWLTSSLSELLYVGAGWVASSLSELMHWLRAAWLLIYSFDGLMDCVKSVRVNEFTGRMASNWRCWCTSSLSELLYVGVGWVASSLSELMRWLRATMITHLLIYSFTHLMAWWIALNQSVWMSPLGERTPIDDVDVPVRSANCFMLVLGDLPVRWANWCAD